MLKFHPSALAAALALALSGLTVAICAAQDSQTATRQQAPALSVTAIQPAVQSWPVTEPASGWLEAWQEAIVSAEISGQRLIAVNVDVGSTVRKGDLLAELSSDTIRNEILQREAAVLTAEAGLEQTAAAALRASKLKGTGTVSQEQYIEASVNEKKARAELASAKAALASAQFSLSQTKILAIDDGVISSRSGALGNVVALGSELFRLIRQGRIEWRAEVPLRAMRNIQQGTKAVLPTSLGDVTGQVRLISPTTSAKNGRLTVFVDLDKPENAPPPTTGILLSGYFDIGASNALTVPSSAITLRDGFSYVFVIKRGDVATVSRERVVTGRRRDGLVEIVDGIAAGVEIVASGGAFLSHGSVIRIVEADNRVETK